MSTERRNVLRLTQNIESHPDQFQQELQRILDRISEDLLRVITPTQYTAAAMATHGVDGDFAEDTVYKNTDTTVRVVQISVKLS